MADTSLLFLASVDTSNLLISCVSPSVQAANTLLLCRDSSTNILPSFMCCNIGRLNIIRLRNEILKLDIDAGTLKLKVIASTPLLKHQTYLLKISLYFLFYIFAIFRWFFFQLAVRGVIFGAIWIILGKHVWLFPNILAEEATLKELFRFWPKKDEEERPKWTARLFYAIMAVLVILLLRHHAPDEAARARYQKRVSNIIDDVLEWSPRLALSGMMEKQQTLVNTTETNGDFTDGSQASTEEVTVDGETSSYQQEDEEVIGNEEDHHNQHHDHIQL
ncbi:hypothetical protein HHK36_017767 [Tetracentron sinense]|uniref:Translocation protein SEC62 n=1 Tax=Tetracentron sinense TaxID=13715 RepID=A0A835DDD7_TETSI|nr:hypothetical protein HHK36_017767 [Tetracentron sinense]